MEGETVHLSVTWNYFHRIRAVLAGCYQVTVRIEFYTVSQKSSTPNS